MLLMQQLLLQVQITSVLLIITVEAKQAKSSDYNQVMDKCMIHRQMLVAQEQLRYPKMPSNFNPLIAVMEIFYLL